MKYVKENNTDLKKYNIYIGEKTNIPYPIGCYEENGIWYLCDVGERQNYSISKEGSKDEVIKYLYFRIKGRVPFETNF